MQPASGTVPTYMFTGGTGGAALVLCRGVDLSAITTTLCYANNTTQFGKVLFDSCRIASSVVRLGIAAYNLSADEVELVNCYDGTSFLAERHTPAGDVTTEFTTTLAGGAQDNVGLFSHKMVSSSRANTYVMPLEGFWLDANYATTGSAKTATVEIVSSASLNNNDITLLVEYEGTIGSSLASFVTSLASPLTAAAAVPTSSATWNSLPATPGAPASPGDVYAADRGPGARPGSAWEAIRDSLRQSTGDHHMSTVVLSGSRAGIGSAVVTETSAKTVNVADVGVVNEAPGGGAGVSLNGPIVTMIG